MKKLIALVLVGAAVGALAVAAYRYWFPPDVDDSDEKARLLERIQKRDEQADVKAQAAGNAAAQGEVKLLDSETDEQVIDADPAVAQAVEQIIKTHSWDDTRRNIDE